MGEVDEAIDGFVSIFDNLDSVTTRERVKNVFLRAYRLPIVEDDRICIAKSFAE